MIDIKPNKFSSIVKACSGRFYSTISLLRIEKMKGESGVRKEEQKY